MLKIDADRPKGLSVQIESEGLETSKLDFTFRLLIEGVEYGFPCPPLSEDSKISVRIPALSSVIKNLKSGIYEAKIEVNGDDKYYLCPFSEQIQIEVAPKMKTTIQEDVLPQEDKKKIRTKAIVEEVIEEPIKEDKETGSDISNSEFF